MNVLEIQPLTQPVQATVSIPGSKSYTLRALLLAALSCGAVRIHNALLSDDTRAMSACLRKLGKQVKYENQALAVSDFSDDLKHELRRHDLLSDEDGRDPVVLDVDLSAASMRFLIALCCLLPGTQILQGREGLNKRPVADLVDSLQRMGAKIEYLDRPGYPPVQISSETLTGANAVISGETSSQYASALLMIAPVLAERLGQNVTLKITGPLLSRPYLEMTRQTMANFGVATQWESEHRICIPQGSRYHQPDYAVEADASSAAYFFALAALTGSAITVQPVNPASAQADMAFLTILEKMGNPVVRHEHGITVTGTGIRPLGHVDMRHCPDQAQTLAVLAAFADGETYMTGLQSLRVKETDRLAAVCAELGKMGIHTEATADTLRVYGGRPHAAIVDTYGDHRMAMAFAVAGAQLPGLKIRNPQVVSKTFPTFWQALRQAGVQTRRPEPDKIVLVGFMGSGKSALGKLLAEELGMQFMDMDADIVQRAGCNSVLEIFTLQGEPVFRSLEQQCAESLENACEVVIATGGGVVMNNVAMAALCRNARVLFLDASLETILERVGLDLNRPLMRHVDRVRQLYSLRQPLYHAYAEKRFSTENQAPERLVEAVLAYLAGSVAGRRESLEEAVSV